MLPNFRFWLRAPFITTSKIIYATQDVVYRPFLYPSIDFDGLPIVQWRGITIEIYIGLENAEQWLDDE